VHKWRAEEWGMKEVSEGQWKRVEWAAFYLTPWCRIFFEKLLVIQLVKE
jgi:hypothetical protein